MSRNAKHLAKRELKVWIIAAIIVIAYLFGGEIVIEIIE